MRLRVRPAALATAAVAAITLAACSGNGDLEPTAEPTTRTPTASPTGTRTDLTPAPTLTPIPGPVVPGAAEEITSELDVPWGLAFLPDGSALVSGRDDASIVHVAADGTTQPVGTVPGVQHGGEGGLLGLAVAPGATPDEAQLYAYLTTSSDNRVVRLTYADGALGEPEVIFEGIPAAQRHNGGRIAFGPDGMLYVGTGEAGDEPTAQDVDILGGKILRLTPEGDVPADNPFSSSPVYSYGHRNVQGLAFDDAGRLWASEFGQDTWDELNLITPGGNYGWPVVEGVGDDERFTEPVATWSTDEASPSGAAYVSDTIFMAGLGGQRLWQIPIPGGEVGEPTAFYEGEYGRLRHVALAPDGSLWLLTNNTDGRVAPGPGDDRILRLTLASSDA